MTAPLRFLPSAMRLFARLLRVDLCLLHDDACARQSPALGVGLCAASFGRSTYMPGSVTIERPTTQFNERNDSGQ